MIAPEQQLLCKVCEHPITQKPGKGHRQRIFCSDRCKQADYRQHHPTKSNVTIEKSTHTQRRIAELEREIATLKALKGKRKSTTDRMVRAKLQERLLAAGETLGYQSLSIQIGSGAKAWQSFARDASEDLLARALLAIGS